MVIINGQKGGRKNTMIYGYARVSTIGQGQKGNSLDDQRQKLEAAGAQQIICDVYTGTKMERPQLSALLDQLRAGDVLMVCKLDRFARTANEGAQLVQELLKRGSVVHVLNMGRLDDTPMGRLMVTMLLAFAEFERDQIVERTQSGKAAARAKGIRVDGRPKKFTEAQINHALELLEAENSYTEVEKMTGISKSTLVRAKRKNILR